MIPHRTVPPDAELFDLSDVRRPAWAIAVMFGGACWITGFVVGDAMGVM